MKITRRQLRQIIREALSRKLNEKKQSVPEVFLDALQQRRTTLRLGSVNALSQSDIIRIAQEKGYLLDLSFADKRKLKQKDQKDLIAYIEGTYQGVSEPDEDPETDDDSADTGSDSGQIDIDDEDDDFDLDFDPDTGTGSARSGKMQTTLRKIYMSLLQAGISKEDIGKLPEFKGKDLGNLPSNPIRISTKRAAELEAMASKGTVTYSIKDN